MIITKTPFRVSFFGGGSDYPSWYDENLGEVISASINKFLFIAIKEYQPFFKSKYRLTYSQIENVNSLRKIKHKVVREALKRYCPKNGLEINYFTELPSNSGIGSSSSFTVGLIKGLKTFNNDKISKENLAKESIYFEQEILKENVGSQDQIAAVFGGVNNIRFINSNKFLVKPFADRKSFFDQISKNLFIVFTGITRSADNIAKTYITNLKDKKNYIREILNHVEIAKEIIKKKNKDEFGYLLSETWNVKKKIGSSVSNSKIDFIYNKGIKAGAIGGKLLGAGSGGFILFYVKDNNKKKFLKTFSKYILYPIEFSYSGSSIIYDKNNSS